MFLVFGVIAGLAWKALVWLFAPPISNALIAVAISSVGEDSIRLLGLRFAIRLKDPQNKGADAAALFGVGFGLVEAIPRWYSILSGSRSYSGATGLVGTLVPILMHVLLCLVLWRYFKMQKAFLGFGICLAIHLVHNFYVLLVAINYSAPALAFDVMARLLIAAALIGWLIRVPDQAPRKG